MGGIDPKSMNCGEEWPFNACRSRELGRNRAGVRTEVDANLIDNLHANSLGKARDQRGRQLAESCHLFTLQQQSLYSFIDALN